jgi:hypothetical protein
VTALKSFILIYSVLALGYPREGDKLDKYGILRSSDGKIRYLERYRAMKACPYGFRPPTAREAAGIAVKYGANGGLSPESSNESSRTHTPGAMDPSGKVDSFEYSSSGYKRPSSAFGKNAFFTSSVVPEGVFAPIILNGVSGSLDTNAVGDHFAVICIPKEKTVQKGVRSSPVERQNGKSGEDLFARMSSKIFSSFRVMPCSISEGCFERDYTTDW